MKPWGRLEQNYINHPKFLPLSAGAICLWHEGKNYCDMNFTDGLIPRDALRTFRFCTRARVQELQQSAGPKATGETGGAYAPLWEVHPVGLKMHDYLNHNDCRETVLARLAEADDQRTRKKQNQQDYRDRLKVERKQERDRSRNGHVTGHVTGLSPAKHKQLHKQKHKQKDLYKQTSPTERQRESYARFFATYPRQEGELEGLVAWCVLDPGPELQAEIAASVEMHRASEQWQDPKFIPLPRTFLAGARWNDRVIETPLTKKELDHATLVRNRHFGCTHDPRCDSVHDCVKAIAYEIREKRTGGVPGSAVERVS